MKISDLWTPEVILMDIEGTTTEIRFVHDVLFPYSYERLGSFLEEHQGDPRVEQILGEAVRLHRTQTGENLETKAIVPVLRAWIDQDRKVTPLKELQGRIWEEGYRQGHYQAHVYDDVVHAWETWRGRGLRLAIYSSGSVDAQKLLFEHTKFGNLCSYLEAYFDTTVGSKKDQSSYQTICHQLGVTTERVLFLSDVVDELRAARQVGMSAVLVDRADGAAHHGEFPVINSFNELLIPARP